MRNLAPFRIGSVIKKLNHIHCQISNKHNRPFPKLEVFWLSKYTYEHRYIRIHDDGRIDGGMARFVSSLVDFSFIRSIVAHKYSVFGFAYDPVSLFLLELFRYLAKYPDMKAFLSVVHDQKRGSHYRLYAGINNSNIPCEAPLSPILKSVWGRTFTIRSSTSWWKSPNASDLSPIKSSPPTEPSS